MDRILTLDEAKRLTEPHHNTWVEATEQAWKDWQRLQTDFATIAKALNSSARAHVLHCLITDKVATLGGGKLYRVGGPGLFLQAIDLDELAAVVRFKQLDPWTLHPKSYPTEQQELLLGQILSESIAEQLSLDGISVPRTVLTFGYTLSQAEDAISLMAVVCHAPELLYYYDIQAGRFAEVLMLPSFEPKAPRITSAIKPAKPTESNDPK